VAKLDRVGEKGTSNQGYSLEIVAYRHSADIDVLVDRKYIQKGVRYTNFKGGRIANMYHKSVLGVGYLGVGAYVRYADGVETAAYISWKGMLERCYNEKFLRERPSYMGCLVCDEWHNFQVYANWHEKNYYTVDNEPMDLDKDILVKGNKIYSPTTCVFVPRRINSLVVTNKLQRGDLPIGVVKTKRNRYVARMGYLTERKSLGTFDTPEEAFLAYKTAKEAYIKQVADEYKDKIPKKLYDALYAYTIEITD